MSAELTALRTLLDQAEHERDEARAQLQQVLARVQAAQGQAEQLRAYRGQYRERWSQQFAVGGAIEIVQCYQSFNERLEQAVQMQQQAVEQQEALTQRLRELLAQREMRVASVRKLIERREQDRRRVQQRQEQKATDEAAQRSVWNGALATLNRFG